MVIDQDVHGARDGLLLYMKADGNREVEKLDIFNSKREYKSPPCYTHERLSERELSGTE